MINSKKVIEYTKNLSILFVEDHKELRRTTGEILKKFFKTVDSAENGIEALEYYNKYYQNNSLYYDIVLSDIQMPKLNGVNLTKELYRINQNQSVIILSAYDDTKYLLPLINLGIEYFIKKPIDYQELLEVLLNTSKKITEPIQTLQTHNKNTIKLDENIFYNKENSSLINNNKNIYLTKYEIIFLDFISTEVGKIYSNEDIVSNYLSLNENLNIQNIRKLVSKLRKKLPEKSIESIYGVGYKLIVDDV